MASCWWNSQSGRRLPNVIPRFSKGRSYPDAGFRVSLFRYQLHGVGDTRSAGAVHRRLAKTLGNPKRLIDGRPAARRLVLSADSGLDDRAIRRPAHWVDRTRTEPDSFVSGVA